MRIFLVLSNFPFAEGEAIEVVGHEIVRLMAGAGHKIDIQVIIRESKSLDYRKRWQQAVFNFKDLDVNFCEPIFLTDVLNKRNQLVRKLSELAGILFTLPLLRRIINSYLFPAICLKGRVKTLVKECKADIILSIWSWEALAATYSISNTPKFVYYGNPDHKPREARLNFPDLFDISKKGLVNKVKYQIQRLVKEAVKIQHIKMMRCCEVTANNSLTDVEYYRDSGHPHSIYLQNMWPQAKEEPVFGGKYLGLKPFRVVGSVGNLGATGNTFGLYFIGNELAPKLEDKFGKENIIINIFGGGISKKKIAGVLDKSSICLRGWVDDINKEIINSGAFLVLTNVNGFVVGNTRILLAWSLGSPLIAHRDSALSMPEIVHGKNALLGSSADEIADLIYSVSKDSGLRERIGRGGYETYKKYYSSSIVVPKMLEEMETLVLTSKSI